MGKVSSSTPRRYRRTDRNDNVKHYTTTLKKRIELTSLEKVIHQLKVAGVKVFVEGCANQIVCVESKQLFDAKGRDEIKE